MGQVASRAEGAPAAAPPLPAVADCPQANAIPRSRPEEAPISLCLSCGALLGRGFAARGEAAGQVLDG